MLRRPQFQPGFRVEVVDGEGVFLLSEQKQVVLPGRLYCLVARGIDGYRSADEIVELLRDRATAAEVCYTLERLESQGYLVEADDTLSAAEAALWALQGVAPAAAAHRLAGTAVAVHSLGSVSRDPLVRLLERLEVRVADAGQLDVVLTDDYLRSGLEERNREALRTCRAWLLLKPVGSQIWVGPLFQPGRTGCWACLAHRLHANRRVEAYVQDRLGRADPVSLVRGFTPATLQIACGIAATAVVRWIGRGELTELEGRVLTLDTANWQTQSHVLMPRPLCPACGNPHAGIDQPGGEVVLQSRRRTARGAGGQESRAASMLQRYGHLVSPITGIVSALVRTSPEGDPVLHAYAARYNPPPWNADLEVLRLGLRSNSGGKGISDLQARASALAEAVECHSSEFLGGEPRRRARFVELAGAAIHPNACMLYSVAQYEQRDTWNASCPWHDAIPVPFDEEAVMDWTPVWSLTRSEVRYLPTALCYFFHPLDPRREASCMPQVHGKGAAETIEDAVLHGLLELVERDHAALWWYNRTRRPALDVDSFDDPYLRAAEDYLRERQRELWVLDLTADLRIPVVAAVSRRIGGPPEHILVGLGAHLDPRLAVLRAVTELHQMLASLGAHGTEEILPPDNWFDDPTFLRWLRMATVANQPYLAPDESVLPRKAADYLCSETDDVRDDVRTCQALIERQGLEVLVLDQTRPDTGMPAVRAIVPGLRHYWSRRLAPGRLYDVPVQLGWLTQPVPESQLNPVSMFE